MPLEIVSRSKLLRLKDEFDEENRFMKIQGIVEDIYKKVMNAAKTYAITKYEYALFDPYNRLMIPPPLNKPANKCDYFITNIPDILIGVQRLFPDTLVQHKIMIDTLSGNRYDVTGWSDALTDKGKPYIVVDWS